ncbi:hypothetical protein ACIA5D_50520 [Actinoplanes sp. NPDC051513]|uniref:hypothetical protein n=1 Tax=Actinoplanes sp. NPDC051513 TaxID=3363908 RepID=UPI00378C7A89
MTPIPLSQWADRNGIPRRTAYNWAKSGKLNVPIHRTLTGRLVVLDDTDDEPKGTHPFTSAYAEALGLPVGTHTKDMHHSPVLEAWGTDLYNAVADDLRPVVLQLAIAAACSRAKRDTWWRLTDWLGRVELADWFTATGFPQIAALFADRPAITDKDSYLDWWPCGVGSFEFWRDFDDQVTAAVNAAELGAPDDNGAAAALAENSLTEEIPIAGRRSSLREVVDKLAGRDMPGLPAPKIPDRSDLWSLRAMYAEPMWALARPYTRRTADMICGLVGWDPQSPAPPAGHPLHEIGYPACLHASETALVPHVHDAHIREIEAFRRIALGKPFDKLAA